VGSCLKLILVETEVFVKMRSTTTKTKRPHAALLLVVPCAKPYVVIENGGWFTVGHHYEPPMEYPEHLDDCLTPLLCIACIQSMQGVEEDRDYEVVSLGR
jgi:hypothetical protein